MHLCLCIHPHEYTWVCCVQNYEVLKSHDHFQLQIFLAGWFMLLFTFRFRMCLTSSTGRTWFLTTSMSSCICSLSQSCIALKIVLEVLHVRITNEIKNNCPKNAWCLLLKISCMVLFQNSPFCSINPPPMIDCLLGVLLSSFY